MDYLKVLLIILFLVIQVTAYKQNPRLQQQQLRDHLQSRWRPTEPPPEMPPNLQQLQALFGELSQRFAVLEGNLQHALDNNDDLQDMIRFQASQINELQSVVGAIPHIITKGVRTDRRVDELAKRASSNVCTCTDSQTAPPRPDYEEWVKNLDRTAVQNMRRNINRGASVNRPSNYSQSNAEMEPQTVQVLSEAFASLLTGQMNGDEPLNTQTASPSDEETDDSRPARRPVRLPYMPRQHQRSVRSSSGRYSRDVSVDDVATRLQDVFLGLISARTHVCFSAIRCETLLGTDESQNIPFGIMQRNDGDNFDPVTGIFNCTVPGVYHFSFTIRSYEGKGIGVLLMLNDDHVVAMITDSSDRRIMQTQSVILTLNEGDQVWLLLGPRKDFAIYGRDDYHYNTFNGMLLYQ